MVAIVRARFPQRRNFQTMVLDTSTTILAFKQDGAWLLLAWSEDWHMVRLNTSHLPVIFNSQPSYLQCSQLNMAYTVDTNRVQCFKKLFSISDIQRVCILKI